MSTAHVYGTPLIGELKETDPTRPATPYAWTHRTAEDLVLASRLVEGVVLRLSNVIGSPADISADCWSLIANDLCRQAVQHQSLSLRGNGRDVRDIIGITDVTRCVAFLLDRPPASLGDGLYNLGGRRTMTMRDLAGMIADRAQRLLGTEIPVHIGPGDGQSPVLVYKVDKLAALGFTPAATLDREIDEMLDFCIRHFSPADAKP
jgi:UDP-glucose 4-epimerase